MALMRIPEEPMNKTGRLNLRLTAEDLEKLAYISLETDKSRSDVVRQLIDTKYYELYYENNPY